jgi:hypothetical protein
MDTPLEEHAEDRVEHLVRFPEVNDLASTDLLRSVDGVTGHIERTPVGFSMHGASLVTGGVSLRPRRSITSFVYMMRYVGLRAWAAATSAMAETDCVSAIRHPDVVEQLLQAGVVEVNRPLEHCGMPRLQVIYDDARRGVPDLRRREDGLPTVDALDFRDVAHDAISNPPA